MHAGRVTKWGVNRLETAQVRLLQDVRFAGLGGRTKKEQFLDCARRL